MKQPYDKNFNQVMAEPSEKKVEDASNEGEHLTNDNMIQPAQDHSLALKAILTCTSILAVIFFFSTIVLAIKLVQSNSQSNPCLHSDPPCQDDWIWHRGRCYYFSKNNEEKNWNTSKSFCSDHNATLVVTESEDIKDFILRFKCSDNYWIGLEKKGQFWKWLNGNTTKEEVLGQGGNCAYLTSVTHFEASSSRCSTPLRWMCSKPDALQKPKGS